MFEKVNPAHPDKIADRIADAIVDYCHSVQENTKVAVKVLIDNDSCSVIAKTSVDIPRSVVYEIIRRIAQPTVMKVHFELIAD